MSNPNQRGPRPLSEVLAELFTVRGYSGLQARQELEEAWSTAVGEPICHQTRLGEVRHGVLSVIVAHSTLLEELAAFRKPALMAALRAGAPGSAIHDIRFRVGPVADVAKPRGSTESSLEASGGGHRRVSRPGPSPGNAPGGKKQGRGSGHGPVRP
jgi:predicted nucleic acid-binding Zn ribbon protein